MSNPQKPQAVSHMLMFFVLPCVVFIGWASWSLIGSLLENKPKDIPARIMAVKEARSSGDRWQAVYALSQELQRMKQSGEWQKEVTPEQKDELFLSLVELQKDHSTDLRFKKYVLLTLGQFAGASMLPHVEESLLLSGATSESGSKATDVADSSEEIRFFAAWSYLELLGRAVVEEELANGVGIDANSTTSSPSKYEANYAVVESWLKDGDPSFRKIAATFLVQKSKNPPLDQVKVLLKDENIEVRWNTAVALASVGDDSSVPVLREMFDIANIRKLDVRSVDDLKQLLASAHDAAQKLDSDEIYAAEEALLSSISKETPEGRIVFEALGR